MDLNQERNQEINQEIDYIKILKILWSRWYWIASILAVCTICAYIYLWYTPQTFSTSASVKLEQENSEISSLFKGGFGASGGKSVESESYVIKSNILINNAINRLDYRVSYFIVGRFRTKEMYPFKPFVVKVIKEDSLQRYTGSFLFKKLDNQKFQISVKDDQYNLSIKKNFGEMFNLLGYTMILTDSSKTDFSDYYFKINHSEDFINRVAKGLSVRELGKTTNIMQISDVDENPYFAKDIVNAVVKEYVFLDEQTKSRGANSTIAFINSQLRNMSNELKTAQNQLKDFKVENKISSIGYYSSSREKRMTNYQEQLVNLKSQNINLDIFEQQIKNNQDKVYLNFNIEGEAGAFLKGLIDKLNILLIERSGKLVTYNEKSNPILELDKQIYDIRDAIIRNIKSFRERQNKYIANLEQELRSADASLAVVPGTEQGLTNLQRTYDINEKVYTLLSSKKLEAEITLSAISAGASVVNLAELSFKTVEPQKARVYSSALLIGIILSLGLILLVRIMNPYVYDKETVESLTSMPIIGVVKTFPTKLDKSNKQVLSLEKPKSVFAESIRSVRTNLSFLASEKNSKVICITSEISGEGKSFMTINLASTLSLIDKKVVIIAADLRKSKMHKAFEVDNDKGLSTYLANQHQIEDVLLQTHVEGLDFVPSGPNPPNPSELIQSERMKILVDYLSSKYDYVLIDTAPIGLVSDSVPLIRQSDINIFVIRSGVSRIGASTIPNKLSREFGLSNMVIILNAFSNDSLYSRYYSTNYANSYYESYYYYADYSGYYGYGYYDDVKPSWWNVVGQAKYYFKKKKNS
ncbi:GumC family protein [Pedobacter arcticus]|uniref:GumC family protein n=1 Tax=Pedobacter arcticus TaxID=752140 RepID=UPI0002E496D4|nr:tyrosine-protein kinase [Pedobacter arcticus]